MPETSATPPTIDHAAIAAINVQAAFNRWAGFEVLHVEPGLVRIAMPWREEVGQYSGFLHAGVIGALLDTACGFAAATRAGRVLASHFSVNCLAPAVGVRFVAEGRVVRAGRKQVFARAELFAEADQASASGDAQSPRQSSPQTPLQSSPPAPRLVATGEAILVPSGA